MPILNFTTKIDAWKTVNEIQRILSKHGVSHFSIKNEGSFPIALSFTINYRNEPLNFLLPCNHEGVFHVLKNTKEIRGEYKNRDHALRVSWRILKDWVESQMAIVEAELAPIQDIFMHCLILNGSGETLANRVYNGDGIKLLN